MSNEEDANQEEPVQEEETVYEEEPVQEEETIHGAEPVPGTDKGRTPWIVAGAVVALLALCTCCVLVVGAYLVGRESVDQPPAAPLPPIEQPIEEQPPQAVIIHPTEAQVGIPVEFDGRQSLPGTYPIARYEWTFGDGATGQGAVVTHVYNTPGTYKVTLKVIDSKGLFNMSGPVEITIKEDAPVQPPLPTILSFTVSPDQIPAGECVGVSWSVSAEATLVQVRRNDMVIIDKGLAAGQQMDCLDQAGSYTYRLEAYNVAGESVFQEQGVRVEEPQQQTPEPPQNPLAGTRWQATAISDAEVGGVGVVLPGTNLTVAFGRDSKVTGSGGCNDYSASYLVDGASLAITPPTGTNMLCDTPEGIMEQETAFLSALASVGSYNLQGDKLSILNASGQQVLELVSAP